MPRYSGQGKVRIGTRQANGFPGVFRDVGEIDPKGVSVEPKLDIFNVKESSSGNRAILERLIQGREATVKFAFQEWSAKNLAMQLLGMDIEVDAGTVTGEVLPSGLQAGDLVPLRNPKVSSVVVKDSASGTPATLDASQYEVESADYGNLLIKDVAGLTQPLKADYSYAAVTQVPMMVSQLQEVCLRIELINTADANRKILVELYRVQFDVGKTLALIQEKGIASPDMEGMLLIDTTKPADGDLGQFGRVVLLG
jgi:hypothetical protein